jgi:hypothetical protein
VCGIVWDFRRKMDDRNKEWEAMGIRMILAVWVLADGVGIWIGGAFLISTHQDDTSLPRRA